MGLLNNDVLLMTMRGSVFGQRILLTHHYQVVGDWGVTTTVQQDLTTLANGVSKAGAFDIQTTYLNLLPPQYSSVDIRFQRIKTIRSAYVSVGGAFAGTNANPATVPSDAACITLRNDLGGRGNVGNKHIGPVPDAASAAGILTPAYQALLGLMGTKLITSIVPAGSGSVMVPGLYNAKLGVFKAVNNFIVGPESRVQRRRTVGLGE